MSATGKIVGVNGNMITVAFDGAVAQNEVGYAVLGDKKLMAEIVRVRGRRCDMQVFDATTDLAVDDTVEFSGNLLAAELGPGMLTQVYDGLQNPLADLAAEAGRISPDAAYFLQRGLYLPGLPRDRTWAWHPTAKPGDRVAAGDFLGWVPEGIFDEKTMPGHKIMVPFALRGQYTVETVAPAGDYTVTETIATLKPVANDLHPASATPASIPVQMMQKWPVKVPIKCFTERLAPEETLETTVRTIDTFFPVAVGGTYCIPGPFGAGKTVLQQTTARYAKIDVVISAACGERAGEVVETLKEFPQLTDPRTGKSLMERTVIICNTSSMPVASREASVYTAVTLAEYYRQMGLNVLVLADSTSRWAQAMRELSGRLEEIPGEEAFPAYLESRIAAFYERAGRVRLRNGTVGSVTIGGTVSPAVGPFSSTTAYGKVTKPAPDVEKARALLEQDGYILNGDGLYEKNGRPLTLTVAYYAARSLDSIALLMQQQLKAAGIAVTFNCQEDPDATYIANRDFDIALYCMIADKNGDPYYFIDSTLRDGGYFAVGGFDSAECQQLIRQLRYETDETARADLANRIVQLAIDDNAFGYVGLFNKTTVMRKGVCNISENSPFDFYYINAATDIAA